MHKSKPGIYMILNILTGDRYIGGTAQMISRRWSQHKYNLNSEHRLHPSHPLLNAWREYGKDTFRCIVLENTPPDPEVIFKREQYWIDKFTDLGLNRYNVCPISDSHQGMEMPDDFGPNQAEIMSQFWQDHPQAKDQMAASVREWWTDERRKERSKSTKELWNSRRQQMLGDRTSIFELRSPSGDIVTVRHLRDFCKTHNLDPSAISKVHQGKRPSHKGWTKP